ncbi:unnamed protein product [marine sediment metagenome]|uniref:Uncharacterized protein n=1 Tax=marine sediment metagenome TaxID=412755 RepID=X0V7G8_9ZZZZ
MENMGKKKKKKTLMEKIMKNPNVPKNTFKIEKTKDYLIVWRKTPPDSKWHKWQNIPVKFVKNWKKIKT